MLKYEKRDIIGYWIMRDLAHNHFKYDMFQVISQLRINIIVYAIVRQFNGEIVSHLQIVCNAHREVLVSQ